jgi:hypothetical protein
VSWRTFRTLFSHSFGWIFQKTEESRVAADMSEQLPNGQTPIEVFWRAADLGLKLGVRSGNKLIVQPIEACPPDFMETLRESKGWLLIMLQWPFCMVYSQTLQQRIFFCEGEDTKAALVEAGVDSFSIYTRDELRVLSEQNRVALLTPTELRQIHSIKKEFNGRVRLQ